MSSSLLEGPDRQLVLARLAAAVLHLLLLQHLLPRQDHLVDEQTAELAGDGLAIFLPFFLLLGVTQYFLYPLALLVQKLALIGTVVRGVRGGQFHIRGCEVLLASPVPIDF